MAILRPYPSERLGPVGVTSVQSLFIIIESDRLSNSKLFTCLMTTIDMSYKVVFSPVDYITHGAVKVATLNSRWFFVVAQC